MLHQDWLNFKILLVVLVVLTYMLNFKYKVLQQGPTVSCSARGGTTFSLDNGQGGRQCIVHKHYGFPSNFIVCPNMVLRLCLAMTASFSLIIMLSISPMNWHASDNWENRSASFPSVSEQCIRSTPFRLSCLKMENNRNQTEVWLFKLCIIRYRNASYMYVWLYFIWKVSLPTKY